LSFHKVTNARFFTNTTRFRDKIHLYKLDLRNAMRRSNNVGSRWKRYGWTEHWWYHDSILVESR